MSTKFELNVNLQQLFLPYVVFLRALQRRTIQWLRMIVARRSSRQVAAPLPRTGDRVTNGDPSACPAAIWRAGRRRKGSRGGSAAGCRDRGLITGLVRRPAADRSYRADQYEPQFWSAGDIVRAAGTGRTLSPSNCAHEQRAPVKMWPHRNCWLIELSKVVLHRKQINHLHIENGNWKQKTKR